MHSTGKTFAFFTSMKRPAQVVGVRRELLGQVGDVGGEQVVGHHVAEQLEPEERELGEHLALVRDRVGQHHVERAEAVGRDEQQPVAEVVEVADLALGVGRRRKLRHEWLLEGSSVSGRRPARSAIRAAGGWRGYAAIVGEGTAATRRPEQ